MIVNKDSWHYKAYAFTYKIEPTDTMRDKTNLCQYVGRICSYWTMLIILATLLILFIGCFAIMIWHHPILSAFILFGFVAIIASSIGILEVARSYKNQKSQNIFISW